MVLLVGHIVIVIGTKGLYAALRKEVKLTSICNESTTNSSYIIGYIGLNRKHSCFPPLLHRQLKIIGAAYIILIIIMAGFRRLIGLSMVSIYHVVVMLMALNPAFVVQGHPFCGREGGGEFQGRFPFSTDAGVGVFVENMT